MSLLTHALGIGDICHVRLNDGQIVTDLTYTGDVDNAGKRYQGFQSSGREHYLNPSYVAHITVKIKSSGRNNDIRSNNN